MRKEFGGPEVLEVVEVAKPVPQADEVLIAVRAFGLNRAELYMRRGEWAEAAPISGIECVGVVEHDPSGRLAQGQTVMACMGGMGRSVNGSYAEYVAVRSPNVLPLETTLDWAALAALPETYATAWSSLQNLALKPGQRLLVRGGSSNLGVAAIALAAQMDVHVTATTRSAGREAQLKAAGAERVVVANPGEAAEFDGAPYDAVLDLIGNRTLLDSMRATRAGGRVCIAGFLGGLAPVEGFNPLAQMPSGVHLSFFGSFELGSAAFPLSAVPMQDIVRSVEQGRLRAAPAGVFSLDQLPQAHALMESGEASGKLVVVL
jgi:NADPH:quinone reductase-like Zn-dependent oxidoreductase